MNPKLIVALVIFAAAVLIFFLNSGDAEELPESTPSIATPYKCAGCDSKVELSDDQYFAKREEVGGEPPFICSACTKQQLYRLYTCTFCSTEFFGAEVPGGTGQCPKCNPPVDDYVAPEVEERKERRVLSY